LAQDTKKWYLQKKLSKGKDAVLTQGEQCIPTFGITQVCNLWKIFEKKSKQSPFFEKGYCMDSQTRIKEFQVSHLLIERCIRKIRKV
jgi:hypothetical protein